MVEYWNRSVDVVVVGSGGGGLCAALTAHAGGADVLILEKEDMIGGSTAMSGGVLWIPNNPLMKSLPWRDGPDHAAKYLESCVGPADPGSTPARRHAFLETGPKIISWLMREGISFILDGRPDYYDELPGGCPSGRSLAVKLFDRRRLGKWQDKLRVGPIPLLVQGSEGRLLTLAGRTPLGMFVAAKVFLRMAMARILGRKMVGLGSALQGWMFERCLTRGIALENNTKVVEFIVEGEAVTGVQIEQGGTRERIHARKGVIIASGGFSRNLEMRQRWQPQPTSIVWTNANPGDTGEMIERAVALGAATYNTQESIWTVSSLMPGRAKATMHPTELAKPHIIVVNQRGERFFDEAGSYMEAGQRIYAAGSVPCWAIMESRHRERYNWGKTPPRLSPSEWVSSGYMKKAGSIAELAAACGIDPVTLADTIKRFNGFVANGKDEDFHRGDRKYDCYWGDPTVKPNPSLGAISKPPFYAVALYPGDVGTVGGLVADEHGRVLREDNSAIEGLYATGNCTASVTGKMYPGAGASIASSFIFGHLAAQHALARTQESGVKKIVQPEGTV